MDKKSLLIGALGSALLFMTLGAANPVTVQTTVPVQHEWEFHLSNGSEGTSYGMAFAINKRTGEVRKYESSETHRAGMYWNEYSVCVPD